MHMLDAILRILTFFKCLRKIKQTCKNRNQNKDQRWANEKRWKFDQTLQHSIEIDPEFLCDFVERLKVMI